MEPLFSKGEIIFVNPEREWAPGDYVIAGGQMDTPAPRHYDRSNRWGFSACSIH